MDNCGVYEIINLVNNHRYIGSSCDIMKRWQRHQEQLRKGNHHSRYLQRAWSLYGAENFKLLFLLQCDRKVRLEREQEFFATHHPEYNVSPYALGGAAPGSGKGHHIVSNETRKRLSDSHKGQKGHPISPEQRAKINEGLKHRKPSPPVSDEARANMTAAQRERREKGVSDEYRAALFAKLSALRKGKPGHPNSPETRAKLSASIMGHPNYCPNRDKKTGRFVGGTS